MPIGNRLKGLLLFGVLFAIAGATATAAAATAVVDPREREARTACLAGDYAKGVALLSELFVETKNPTYLYNQGRCYEQNARYGEAVARFNEYLRVGKQASAEERADAQQHVADCKEMLASQASPPSVAAVPAAPPSPPAVSVSQPVTAVTAADDGSRLRTAGIVTAAAGAGSLLAGILLNLKVNSLAEELERPNGYTSGKESDRQMYQTLGWLGYGVGAACLATGTVLYVLGSRTTAASAGPVALVPVMSASQAGVALRGAF